MIQKVVHHRGGLHNRITRQIYLEPFNLSETARFLAHRKVRLDSYYLLQLYMVTGGILHYLKQVLPGKSASQSINQLCFSKNGLLRDEFPKLYHSLFSNAENHIAVIRCLAQRRQGMTREQIVKSGNTSGGGSAQRVLEELERSGFIAQYRPFDKRKKEKLYRLADEYSLFYLQFMENRAYEGEDVWHLLSQTQEYKTWSGYAFENICFKHLPQIKRALGLSGIGTLSSSFYKKGDKNSEGAQIDLVIDRSDHTVNLFEIKFSAKEYAISAEEAATLHQKMRVFRQNTRTKKQLFFVYITTFGLLENQYSASVARSLTMDCLFV